LLCAAGLVALSFALSPAPARSASTSTTLGPSGKTTQSLALSPSSGTFATCPYCHARLDRPDRFAARINPSFTHEKHLAAYQATCESCHRLPTHTREEARRPTMQSCYVCHGKNPASRTRAYCALCHPASFPLRPPTHTPAFYGKGHAEAVAVEGAAQCFMCHEGDQTSFCRACHGVDIPHPADWTRTATGRTGAHVADAHKQGAVCTKCHQNRPDPPGNCYGGECHGT
jgi:hypothetical protein